MKIFLHLILLILLASIVVSCETSARRKIVGVEPEQLVNVKDGVQNIYSKSGKIEATVEVKNGKANGRVQKFFPDGKIYMDAIYGDGIKNGKCIYYYGNGKVYTVSFYQKGYKEGPEKKYYEEGGLMAEYSYKKNVVQAGLKEYKKDGSPIVNNDYIVISESNTLKLDGSFKLFARLKSGTKAKYTITELSNPKISYPIKYSNDGCVSIFHLGNGDFLMTKLLIQAVYKTTRGNTMKIEKIYNMAIDN